MRCINLDFTENAIINPASAYRIGVGYLLSDAIDIMGACVFLLIFEVRFEKMSLWHRAKVVYQFQVNEPEAKQAFEDFFTQQHQKKTMKHLPNVLFVLAKKTEKAMEVVIGEWIVRVQGMLKEAGFFSFSNCFEKGVLQLHFFDLKETNEDARTVLVDDVFANKVPIASVDKAIWLLSEGFYNEDHLGKDCIINIDEITPDKPYLIKCLNIPNLISFTSPEMFLIKKQLHPFITLFKEEAELWATKCYTNTNGIDYFKEKLMPTMASVQAAIDNDAILKQWIKTNAVKQTSAVYFGEISPLILWNYYKKNLVLTEEIYNKLVANYATKQSYTIPVMVFAYNMPALKLATGLESDEVIQENVLSIKKYLEV